MSLRTRAPFRSIRDISSFGSLLAADSMNLQTHTATSNQSAVLQYVPAADCAHTLPESVSPHPFFLFRLIDTLRHVVSILNSGGNVYGATSSQETDILFI